MKMQKPVSMIVTAVLLTAAITISSLSVRVKPEHAAVSATPSEAESGTADEEMRGVWISFMELSMEYESDKSEAAFRQKFAGIAAICKSMGFNTLVVQVRPFCDALYDSKLFPASHILSGEQGKSAGYDALELMCDIAKADGLKLHAWINPYRVTADKTPETLSADNPYSRDSSLGVALKSGVILDPSSEKARRLITDGVAEIVSNYEVDGVQIDDYFYPEDIGDSDAAQYAEYLKTAPKGSAMDRQEWRKANVNLLISELYLAVHKCKKGAVFGISPQGNLSNNEALYADVVNWCTKKGFADYICPQIYFSLDNPALGFEAALNEWTSLDFADGVRLYVGLAGYKAGTDADEGTWLGRDDVLAKEINILNKNNKVSGHILYSYSSLNNAESKAEIQNYIKASSPSHQSSPAETSLTGRISPHRASSSD